MEITHCARLGGVYNYDSTAIRPRYDHSATYVTTVCGLLTLLPN